MSMVVAPATMEMLKCDAVNVVLKMAMVVTIVSTNNNGHVEA
jgi:hypothetical protein